MSICKWGIHSLFSMTKEFWSSQSIDVCNISGIPRDWMLCCCICNTWTHLGSLVLLLFPLFGESLFGFHPLIRIIYFSNFMYIRHFFIFIFSPNQLISFQSLASPLFRRNLFFWARIFISSFAFEFLKLMIKRKYNFIN